MKRGMMILMSLIIASACVLSGMDWFSEVNQNTRSLVKKIQDNSRTEGFFSDFIDFEYQMLVVFDETVSKEKMEQMLGFTDMRLMQSEEGMHNIVFVNQHELTAYLYGYDSFHLNMNAGTYTKEEVDDLIYHQQKQYYTIQMK